MLFLFLLQRRRLHGHFVKGRLAPDRASTGMWMGSLVPVAANRTAMLPWLLVLTRHENFSGPRDIVSALLQAVQQIRFRIHISVGAVAAIHKGSQHLQLFDWIRGANGVAATNTRLPQRRSRLANRLSRHTVGV